MQTLQSFEATGPSIFERVNELQDTLGGKWKVHIIFHLHNDRLRFSELKRKVGEISEKVLTDQLKGLLSNGLIIRETHEHNTRRVHYKLSSKGMYLADLMSFYVKKVY